ncbi:putative toxin-antitoxin system toxin component, PIN family [Dyadobacter sandarakinus]|uniref:putative toxin-antitoxin system toxin component, PIN family n=1 Tax=Dyadobacter sandarakinus TaxID=2747268 RepID=UPI0021D3FD8D|nr:putative toxin-antitoxin system toxin component, PIN family [Dyadobacter sandarakinus]
MSKNFSRLDQHILSGKVKLLFSQELLDKFIEVASRLKFTRYFSANDIKSVVTIISDYSEFVFVTTIVNECRDEKDNFLLALGVDGQVDVLITGDADLLTLDTYRGTRIQTITAFLEQL